MSKKAIVSVTNDLYTDRRVDKICHFLNENGYKVLLVGRKKKDSPNLEKRVYKTKRLRLFFEKGALFYAEYNLRLFFFLLFKKTSLLVANDLDTLLANYIASKIKKSTLVYDSHELFTEVPELVNRPIIRAIWKSIERFIFPKLKKVYTVNQSIADIYSKEYKVNVKVVRNIAEKWNPEKIQSKKELGIPEDKKIIILQGAGINIDRGAEEAVEAMQKIDAYLLIVGDGDVVPTLKNQVKKLNLSQKVLFFGKKPYHTMMNYTYHADIGLTLDKDTNLNYKYSLPNKVFDYMHAGTAIVATNIKEVRKIIENHQIGEIIENFNTENLTLTLNHLLKDERRLSQYKENCKKASLIENWEQEKEVLKSIYSKIEK